MNTEIIRLGDDAAADAAAFARAGEVIRRGGLVAFPTETVYGLGANVFDENAVKKIYAVKGRPSDNPLIVHIANENDLRTTAANVPGTAEKLIEAFWPGPLTIVLEKSARLPLSATGGLNTAAVRCPESNYARRLIAAAGVPVAAPSANISGRVSPTEAEHVVSDFKGAIDMILDGGGCRFGIESTIVDVTGEKPRVLRPGSITTGMLESVLGSNISIERGSINAPPAAPGMKYSHYAPLAKVTVVAGRSEDIVGYINRQCAGTGLPGIFAADETAALYTNGRVIAAGKRSEPEGIARNLYGALRKFDYWGVPHIYCEAFYETELGLSIMNRMEKAAGYNIVRL